MFEHREMMGWKISRNSKNNVIEIRKDIFTPLTGGQVLVTVGNYRTFKDAIRHHNDYLRYSKEGYSIPEWMRKHEEKWKENGIHITYGQNGTTEWVPKEWEELSSVVDYAILCVRDRQLRTFIY